MSNKRALFCASMLGGLVAAASAVAAPALPTGGTVQAGSAKIAGGGATLTVSQSSSKAIIDWSSFSIGQGGTVQFENGSGATLNRVTGSNISSIDGLLSATGSVYLINPNGVIVGKSGVIDTGGSFVASTLDVANASFLAGGPLAFSGPSTASVVNLGKVGSLGGNVAMIAATVNNAGSIAAPKGDVGLIAGTTVTMDDADNDAGGLFSVKVGGPSTSATNSGAIAAAAVELRAQQGNVYALAGNTGGVINATGIDASGGVIKLISEGGTTTVAGTLDAQGPSGTGGRIETSGQTLNLGAARVDTHGGAWLLDPTDLTIDLTAATAIDDALDLGTSVTLATTSSGAPTESGVTGATGNTAGPGAGDILVGSALSWTGSAALTLNAYGDIVVNAPISFTNGALILNAPGGPTMGPLRGAIMINAPITVDGAGQVTLTYAISPSFDLGPTGFGGSLSYAVGTGEGIAGQALTINGSGYTLLYSLSDIAALNGRSGDFALAAPITATTLFTAAVAASFSGTLEGLGNTITGLTINGGSNNDVGLIGQLSGGTAQVRDLGLVGGTVSGSNYVGGLIGKNSYGTVATSYATGKVSGSDYVGGLVGYNTGSVATSFATGAVSGSDVGGLVGTNGGVVYESYATGAVSGNSYVGGLVGVNGSQVEFSYATGAVSGNFVVGGLVGGSGNATQIQGSYAAGAVSGSQWVGGLAGRNYGDLKTSHATGAVSGSSDVGGLVGLNGASLSSDVVASYATGAVSGNNFPVAVGGLVGENQSIVELSYATGAVRGGSESFAVGGLVGVNQGVVETSYATGAVSGMQFVGGLVGNSSSTVETSYATGAVTGVTDVGGLIGESIGSVSDSYWDTDTTGQSGAETGAIGLTTAQLQSNYNGYMSNLNAGAAFAGGTGGLYPYLTFLFPNGVQAVSGFAPTGGTVAMDVAGASFAPVSVGANGYYYQFVAAGTISGAGSAVIAYSSGTNGGARVDTLTGTTTDFDILPSTLIAPTSDISWSSASGTSLQAQDLALIAAAAGSDATATSLVSGLTNYGYIATGSSFTIDVAPSLANGLYVETTAASATLTLGAVGPLTLPGANSLYLLSSGALDIDAPIGVTGAGAVSLSGSALNFAYGPTGFTGNVAFTDVVSNATQGSLAINGQSFTLENNLAKLASDIAANPGGFYALANSYDAQSDGSYGTAVIPTTFTGTFEGLGNSISNLTISANTAPADEDIGLFASVTGAISDLAIVGGSLTGNANVGALAGTDLGNVNNVHSSMAVTGFGVVGGLVGEFGEAGHALTNSSSSGDVTGVLVDASSSGEPTEIGGLIGQLDAGNVTASYATGPVTALGGDQIGGLIGYAIPNNNVVVSHSYATGAVDAGVNPSTFVAGVSVGGLIGDNGGAVIDSYATGAVLGTQNVGGLIGFNENDAPGTSATSPTGDGTVVNSYATGAVTGYIDTFGNEGIDVGGLIGYNQGGVANAFAFGAVIGGDQLGGLIGTNEGSLSSVYSTGLVQAAVGASPTAIGGLVGEDDSGGDIQNAYWDTLTSGQPTVGIGLFGTPGAVTGFTTGQLQSMATIGVTLGPAFAGGAAGGENGVYPYLVDFFPNGVQAVSGFAPTGGTVAMDVAGQSFAGASVGANGYFYQAVAAGTISGGAGSAVIAYSSGGDGGARVDTIADTTTGAVTGLDILPSTLIAPTAFTSWSTASATTLQSQDAALIAAAEGSDTTAASLVGGLTSYGYIATGAGFTINVSPSLANGLYVETTAADATLIVGVNGALTLPGANSLYLLSSDALIIDAPISIAGAGEVTLGFDTASANAPGGLSFDLSPTGFGGSLSYAVGGGEGIAGQALTINGTPYTLLYSMIDVAGINGSSSAYALAAPITATGSHANAVVGGFSGTLEGLGNSISGLSINSSGNYVGLIGKLGTGGVLRDIGLSGGSVAGLDYVGGLVGYSDGSISDAMTSGATVSTNGGEGVGGLVGLNRGAITGSTAADTVENDGSGSATGGLVGYNAAGALSGDAASGTVSGGVYYTGGLVGFNDGAISGASSATGDVSAPGGGRYIGGLVGYNFTAGTITGAMTSGATVSANDGGAVGGLAGFNRGTITGSTAADTVDNNGGGYATGGLVGYNAAGASLSGDAASGTVNGGVDYTGGLVGFNDGAISGASSATGDVSAPGGGLYVGGLVGYNFTAGTITGASTSGATVSADGGAVGGLVGLNRGTVSSSTAADAVENNGSGYATGGLVGDDVAGATISSSSATGTVSGGAKYTGGLVGYNAASAGISSSFATGTVTGGAYDTGGLAGYNDGSISDTYAYSGSISGGAYLGGLVGVNAGGVLSTSWSSGAVAGTSRIGGSIGDKAGGTVSDVYWDEGTSGKTLGVGAGASAGVTGIGGATSLSPQVKATYAGFNFTTTWTINPGASRAYLKIPAPATPPN